MNCNEIAILCAALLPDDAGRDHRPRPRPRFQTYRCGDGTEFIVGFFQYDKRAHMQVDGKSVTLQKRVGLTGARYSGGGVTLTIRNRDHAQGRQAQGDGLRVEVAN